MLERAGAGGEKDCVDSGGNVRAALGKQSRSQRSETGELFDVRNLSVGRAHDGGLGSFPLRCVISPAAGVIESLTMMRSLSVSNGNLGG